MYRRLQRLSKIKLMITLMMMAARSQAFNDGHIITASFRDVGNIIQNKIDTYGAEKVLLALDIDNTTLGFEKDFGSEHWFLQNPGDAGLSAQELIDFGITSSRPVMFQEGVFLTDGQHKGAMLRTLIHKLNLRFDAIIFVDDRLKHSEAMQAAFKDRPEALTTIQYAHNAQRIAQWRASDKGEAKQDWCQFSKAILAVHEHPADADIIPCR